MWMTVAGDVWVSGRGVDEMACYVRWCYTSGVGRYGVIE